MFRFEDLLVILLVALLLFGPNKMVDFAKSLGNALREFKKATNPDEGPQRTASTPASPAPSALPPDQSGAASAKPEAKPADSAKNS